MQINLSKNTISSNKLIAVINRDEELLQTLQQCNIPGHEVRVFKNAYELFDTWKRGQISVSLVISCGEIISSSGTALLETFTDIHFPDVPFIIYASNSTERLVKVALRIGVADVFTRIPDPFSLKVRLSFLIENWQQLRIKAVAKTFTKYRTPLPKRLFDIVFASLALLLLSPVFLLVALFLKLESTGPVFYYSLRVGTGYRLFKFYKFRSMYVNADERLKDLKHLNQYNTGAKAEQLVVKDGIVLCDQCAAKGTQCQSLIYADTIQWCERVYADHQKTSSGSAFIKIKDDPRITRVGNFIRNMSIDELPQLWNVLIGDMSIVGNRPLPLYEAEKLTTDTYIQRFLAPAGMTGLWQVEKRGKGNMSEEERLMLDNVYAENHSFLQDIRLILRTVPAIFQKENV